MAPRLSANGQWLLHPPISGCISVASITRVAVYKDGDCLLVKVYLRGNQHGYQESVEYRCDTIQAADAFIDILTGERKQ